MTLIFKGTWMIGDACACLRERPGATDCIAVVFGQFSWFAGWKPAAALGEILCRGLEGDSGFGACGAETWLAIAVELAAISEFRLVIRRFADNR